MQSLEPLPSMDSKPTLNMSQVVSDKGRLSSSHHGIDAGHSSPASEHHYAGPSRVNWLCNAATPSPTSPSPLGPKRPPSALAIGRSISSPSPLSSLTGRSRIYRHPALSSNRSLQIDMSYYGCGRSAQPEDNAPKPLTPIIEQVYHPVERRRSPGANSPMTPGTPASLDQGAVLRILAPLLIL